MKIFKINDIGDDELDLDNDFDHVGNCFYQKYPLILVVFGEQIQQHILKVTRT